MIKRPLTDRYLALPLPRISWALPPTIHFHQNCPRNHQLQKHTLAWNLSLPLPLPLCGVSASGCPWLTGLPWYSWTIPDLSPQRWERRATCALSSSSWCCSLYVWIGWRKSRVFRDAKLFNKRLATEQPHHCGLPLPPPMPQQPQNGQCFLCRKLVPLF